MKPQVGVAELGAAWLGILAGIALATVRALNGESYERALFPTLAFGALVALPGVLALMARLRRPNLYLASGMIYVPLSFLSGVALPLLIVSAMAFVAYGRHAEEETPLVWGPLVAMILTILAIAAFIALLLWEDPRCAAIPNGVTCSSDITSSAESVLSLCAVGAALASGWFMSRPQPGAVRVS